MIVLTDVFARGALLLIRIKQIACHPERTGPQTCFSLGVVSRKPALSAAEGDQRLFLIRFKNEPEARFEAGLTRANS
jgi:hypothetical protein